MADTLFPITNAEKHLSSYRPGVERSGNTLRWPDYDGVTELTVEPLNYRTHDGLLVAERVTVSHTTEWMGRLTPDDAAAMNTWATLSTFIPPDADDSGRLTCKVDVFSTDREAAELVYAPLICSEAAIIGWHAARMGRRELQLDSELSPLHGTNEPPPFDATAFAALLSRSSERGFLGSHDEGFYCVELPWDPGALSRQLDNPDVRKTLLTAGDHTADELDRMASATSLFTLTTNVKHALYGNGVLGRFEIPIRTDESNASTLIDELNRWELSGQDLPPLFGAWCMGPRAPTFVTFVPNQFCVPGLLQNQYFWTLVRHSRVRDWLTSSRSRN